MVLLLVLGATAVNTNIADGEFSLSGLVQRAAEAGPMAFAVLNAVCTFLAVLPSAPFCVAAGVFYGSIQGTIVYVLSTTLGAVALFAFVRSAQASLLHSASHSDALLAGFSAAH